MPAFVRASAAYPLRAALALLISLALVVACNQAAVSTAPVATDRVDLPRSYRFAPEAIVVQHGTTVTWSNNDNFTHSVRLLEGGSPAQFMKPGESVTLTFDVAGLYAYDCSLHPTDMKGTVLVQ
jgi:plastocyanin